MLNDVWQDFLYCFDKALKLIFDDMRIESGISIGWILLGGAFFTFLLSVLIHKPYKFSTPRHKKNDVYDGNAQGYGGDTFNFQKWADYNEKKYKGSYIDEKGRRVWY